YALRPWPWIIVALASMIIFPNLSDIAATFPYVDPHLVGHDMAYSAMLKFLPTGFLGVMIAGMLAAYVSTLSTHLNWGTSYIVHDFYRRFVRQDADERHYVFVGRVVTALLMFAAAGVTLALDSARQSFNLLMSIGAGTGLIYLLRWFWWRINAWSEIAAMASSFVIAVAMLVARRAGVPISDSAALIASVAFTTVVWVAVTLLTPPTDQATLIRFYECTRPAGPGWNAVRAHTPLPPSPDSIPQMLLGWTAGVTFVYAGLFGTGNFIYGHTANAIVCVALFVASGVALIRLIPRSERAGG